jgi:hypothetical protein
MRSANTRARAGKRLPANNFISDSVEDGSNKQFAGPVPASPQETIMNTQTLLIIIIVLLVVGGGGYYGHGHWF